MGIINVTPDSFSDGGKALRIDDALKLAERLAGEGAAILDIGGESTRPGSEPVPVDVEIERVVPLIEAISARIDIPLSVDTSKAEVARAALESGAEIVNDISGLRFDRKIASVAAETGAGLILMHSRGAFSEMHSLEPVEDIFSVVETDLSESVAIARENGVSAESLILDVGLGFGKTFEQNLSLLANLDRIVTKFKDLPFLVGASRKSFIGRACDAPNTADRLGGSIAAAIAAVNKGAKLVRVHDVFETVQALRFTSRITEI